jgi:hypothetical protein
MSFNSTPADKIFPDVAIVLSGDRKQDPVTREWDFTECIFYADYHFEDRSVSIGVFDDVTRTYLYETEYLHSVERAVAILEAIDVEYPGKINVKELTSSFKLFFLVAENAVGIDTPVTDFSASCEQCGDYNVDTLKFLYVPAVEGTLFKEGSIDLHWEYGCYGGTRIEGNYEDNYDAAKELLERAKSMASPKKYKREIQKAIVSLKPQDS